MKLTEQQLRDVARAVRRSVGHMNTESALAQAIPLAIEQMSNMAELAGVDKAQKIAKDAVERVKSKPGFKLMGPGEKFRELHKAIAKALKQSSSKPDDIRVLASVSVPAEAKVQTRIQTPGTETLAGVVRDSLRALKQRRPIFHSEGDLRHDLGWELSNRGVPNMRAEKPFYDKEIGAGRVDLAAAGFVAELKYFTTTNLEKTVDGEKFVVAGAPHRRGSHYTFWEDVWRVERLVVNGGLDFGCVICVSNYPSMWEEGRMRDSESWLSDFWMADGKTFPRRLKLGSDKPATNKKWAVRKDIHLLQEHALKWEEWHNFPDMKDGRFRYVVVEIRP